jgi:hypothetical protein
MNKKKQGMIFKITPCSHQVLASFVVSVKITPGVFFSTGGATINHGDPSVNVQLENRVFRQIQPVLQVEFNRIQVTLFF